MTSAVHPQGQGERFVGLGPGHRVRETRGCSAGSRCFDEDGTTSSFKLNRPAAPWAGRRHGSDWVWQTSHVSFCALCLRADEFLRWLPVDIGNQPGGAARLMAVGGDGLGDLMHFRENRTHRWRHC
jgi:hypothetical protein